MLENAALISKDSLLLTECRTLSEHVSSWGFLVCLISWYEVLHEINRISKALQSPNVSIDTQRALIESAITFLEKYREAGPDAVETTAREIAEDLNVDRAYPQHRSRKKARQFSYEAVDESGQQSAKDEFRTNFFFPMLDSALSSLHERFDYLTEFHSQFGFLYGLKNMALA
jgi:hypothetical protein